MISAVITEIDFEMVARAGDWLDLVDAVGATEEEQALACICAGVEAELREREWALFEQLIPHTIDGQVVPPADDAERLRILRAMVGLEMHHRVPKGRAQEAGIA